MGEAAVLRRAEEGDCAVILELIRELAEYEGLEEQVVATSELLREWIFARGRAEALLAEEDGQAVGFALYFHSFSTFLGRAGLYLEDLYVRPSHRGRGVGKRLLTGLARIAVERGCGRLEWSCLDWNQPSIDFYQSLGARPMSGWTTYRVDGETLRRMGGGDT